MKYFVPGHLLGSSRPEMEKCSVMPLVQVHPGLMILDFERLPYNQGGRPQGGSVNLRSFGTNLLLPQLA